MALSSCTCGGRNRFFPIGAAANGIPLKNADFSRDTPSTIPLSISTIGPVSMRAVAVNREAIAATVRNNMVVRESFRSQDCDKHFLLWPSAGSQPPKASMNNHNDLTDVLSTEFLFASPKRKNRACKYLDYKEYFHHDCLARHQCRSCTSVPPSYFFSLFFQQLLWAGRYAYSWRR